MDRLDELEQEANELLDQRSVDPLTALAVLKLVLEMIRELRKRGQAQ